MVQEFALAKNITVLIGNREISAEILTKGITRASIFSSFSGPEKIPRSYIGAAQLEVNKLLCDTIGLRAMALPISDKIDFLNQVRASCRDSGPRRFSLGRLIYHTKRLAIGNREDRVDAVLGMCRAEDVSMLKAADA